MFRFRYLLTVLLGMLSTATLRADFSYQQTSQITGGTLLHTVQALGALSAEAGKIGNPEISMIYVKGDRMATVQPNSISIIDLNQEAFIHIDLQHRTWYKLTFAEMKVRFEKLHAKMTQHTADDKKTDVDVNFDVRIRKTGAQQDFDGMKADETILTLLMDATSTQNAQQSGNMSMTSDLWLVPEIQGYNELRDFQRRYALKLAGIMDPGMEMSASLLQRPGSAEAMARLAAEAQKLHGVPVLTISRMGSTADGSPIPAASEAPLPADTPTPSASDLAKQGAVSVLTSRLPFGGFGHKKNADSDKQNADANSAQKKPVSVLMETKVTMTNFSTAPVDPSHFDIPAGFREVSSPSERH